MSCRLRRSSLRTFAELGKFEGLDANQKSGSAVPPRKISEKAWSYTLYETDDGRVLSVVCGGAAIYELNILLEPDDGLGAVSDCAFLDLLASDIRSNPDKFASRAVKI